MQLTRSKRSWLALATGATLALGCTSSIVEEGSEAGPGGDTGDSGPSAGSTGLLETTSGTDTYDPYGSTGTGGVGVTTDATYSTGVYTTYATDTWGTTSGSTWAGTEGGGTGSPVVDPRDCDYLGPDECEGQGGTNFACVLRTGYLLESAASCTFDEFEQLCIAVELPQLMNCEELPSCPAQGTATIWTGDSMGESVVLIQQGCERYPSLDYCIADSPDPSCACACAADVAG